MNGLLGLTKPNFINVGGQQQGQGGSPLIPQGFLGNWLGQGFGSLFGNSNGLVNFGGGNFFQPGQGLFNTVGGGGINTNLPSPGLNLGSLLSSLFGK